MPDVNRGGRFGGVLRARWERALGDYPTVLRWSDDGLRVFVGDASGLLHAFDGRDGAPLWTRPVHPGGVLALSAQPRQGGLLATGGQDGRALLLDVERGDVVRVLTHVERWMEGVAWSPDGERVAASSGRTASIWSARGEALARCDAHTSTVSGMCWNGPTELLTACYGRVSVWNASTGARTDMLEWKGSLVSLALSPNGEIAACGSQDKTVHFWRRSSGQDSTMWGYRTKPSQLAFDADSVWLATGGSQLVTVWSFSGEGPEGTDPVLLEMHTLPISALRFAHHGPVLASGGKEGGVAVWTLAEGRGELVGMGLGDGAIESLAFSPDDDGLACIDAAGNLIVWDYRRS